MSNGYDATAPVPTMPAPAAVPVTYTVILRTKRTYACAKAEPVPPEEFGISKRARCVKEATYCYHEPAGKTQAELINQGYDRDQIEGLPSIDDTMSMETSSRNRGSGNWSSTADASNRAMRPIRITEHYIRMAYESDEPALYRVTTGGDKMEILKRKGKEDIVQVDAMPFAVMTPIIVTHRVFGRSIADLVMDIQKIKTALLRALLDNAYLANNQRLEMAESHMHERTLDDLLVNRPGGIVRTKIPGGLTPIPNQTIGGHVFPLIEYLDGTREWRTGVTRQGQGIDANALQNQTAHAVNQVFTAAQARIKLIARVMAETGIRDLFALLHATIRKNDRKQNTVRLRNKWVNVDPRAWKTRDDMTINVGLGTGSKEAQIGHLMTVLGIQKEMMLGKLPTVTPKNLYNTAAKLVEKIDLKTPEPYFTDPESPQGQQLMQAAAQQPPDPKMIEMQAKMALEEKQAQADAAVTQNKINAEMQQAELLFQHKMQLAQEEHRMKMQEMAVASAQKQEQPRGVMEFKHNADQITEPIAEVVRGLGDHIGGMGQQLGQMQAQHTQTLLEALNKMNRPRRIVRDKNGRISHVEQT